MTNRIINWLQEYKAMIIFWTAIFGFVFWLGYAIIQAEIAQEKHKEKQQQMILQGCIPETENNDGSIALWRNCTE